jgi:predicted AAA+ superfamily ATPase
MIPRPRHLRELKGLLKSYPVVGIVGPRQVGKTTLAGTLAKHLKGDSPRFDLAGWHRQSFGVDVAIDEP